MPPAGSVGSLSWEGDAVRKAFSILLMAALGCLMAPTQDAGATVTFSLVWVATTGAGVTGANSIDAMAGDVLTLGIQMTNDQTLTGHSVSLNFDTDLGNELNLLNPNGGKNWNGTSYGTFTYSELAPVGTRLGVTESTGSTAGRINSYNGGDLFGFLPVGTYVIGTARFVATSNVATDGNDVFVGLFNTGIDDVLGNDNYPIPVGSLVFEGAAVNLVPEPGTASLVGLGLVGLVLAGRRYRRS